MSSEPVTKRRRLDQASDLSTPCPETAVHLPPIYDVLNDANTWTWNPVELENTQQWQPDNDWFWNPVEPENTKHDSTWNWNSVEPGSTKLKTAPPECQICCQLDLWPMFAQDTSEISAGRLSQYLDHSCPFADLVQEALRLRCDSSWATVMETSDPDTSPDLLFKSRGWVFTRVPGKKDYRGIVNQKVKNHHPRVILAINKRPPGVESTQTRKRLVDSLDTPYIIAELERVDRPSAHESAMHQGIPYPTRRPVEKYLDCSQARQWLENCKHHHKGCKKDDKLFRQALFWQHPGFRLIDVHHLCLVRQIKPCDYVALSYVWGKSAESSLCTEKSNVDALGVAGALDLNGLLEHEGRKVSRTIIDAMHLVQRLGYRFLWVDALCIIQDDPEEKQRLIHGMDRVYQHASLTIVCATGTDADSGLHGISPRETLPYESAFTLLREDLTSYTVAISRPSLVDQVRKCHWNKRGWTYQEHCLSQRCLYFTADEVFFSCSQFQPREGPGRLGGATEFIKTRNRHRINPFQGIFNRFCGLDASEDPWAGHAQGIPPRFLPAALLWYPLKNTTKRLCDLEQGGSKVEFSSWSWAAWSGPVDFVYSRNSGLDSTWDSTGFISGPSYMCSLVVEWNFPPSTSPIWKEARSLAKSDLENLGKAFHLEFEAIDKFRSQGHRPIEAPSNGLVEFWAPVLLSQISFSHWKENLFNINIGPPPGSPSKEALSGRFRFDGPGEAQEVDKLVAIMASPGVISCIGVVRKDEKTFTRIGIGSIFAPNYLFFDNTLNYRLLTEVGLRTWEIRLIRMC